MSVSAIRFDRHGNIVDAYPILMNTLVNCAGGATPWGTWLSCEEHDNGYVWECDPSGSAPAIRRDPMGKFKHEAVAVDGRRRRLYLSEDHGDGCFYRFNPQRWTDLSAGTLEVAAVGVDGSVGWLPIPDPGGASTPTRHQVSAATRFSGGEGVAYHRGHVFLATKGDNRIWDYDIRRERMSVLYEAALDPLQQLTGVDNIAAAKGGDLLVAEDGGNMELVLLSPDRIASPLLRVVGQSSSEIAGPAFEPRNGDRLYFSSQRGDTWGITYEVTGPFRRRAPRRVAC